MGEVCLVIVIVVCTIKIRLTITSGVCIRRIYNYAEVVEIVGRGKGIPNIVYLNFAGGVGLKVFLIPVIYEILPLNMGGGLNFFF